jgi:hypothetical protein
MMTGTMGIVIGPSEPQDLGLERQGDTIVLSWNEPGIMGSSPIIGYRIFLDGMEIANLSSSQTTYVDGSVDLSLKHTYSVLAFNEDGEGVAVSIIYGAPGENNYFIYSAVALITIGAVSPLIWYSHRKVDKE